MFTMTSLLANFRYQTSYGKAFYQTKFQMKAALSRLKFSMKPSQGHTTQVCSRTVVLQSSCNLTMELQSNKKRALLKTMLTQMIKFKSFSSFKKPAILMSSRRESKKIWVPHCNILAKRSKYWYLINGR